MHQLWMYMSIILFAPFSLLNTIAQDYRTGLTQEYEIIDEGDFSSDSLNINVAVNSALNNNLEIREAFLETEALEKVSFQQGLISNPQLSLDAENIFGSKNFNGFNGSELTATISQDVLLAGKLSKLKEVTELETHLAYFDYESKRLEIITKVRKAFNDVVKTQALIEKQNELLDNTNSFIQNVKQRNKEGAVSSIEVLRANLVYNKLQIDLISKKQQLKTLKKNLTTLMGINENSSNIFIVEKKVVKSLPKLEKLKELQNINPAISKSKMIEKQDYAKIDYEKSLATPDLTIGAGIKRMNESNANTFLIGFSLPLPIFNRNQGNIAEAEIRMDQNRIQYDGIRINMGNRLTELYNEAVNFLSSLSAYKEKLLPQAKDVLVDIKKGYNQGRYKILDVIDSQNTLIEFEINYIEIQSAFLNTIYEIENQIATNIDNVK
jgi:outer membrane protein, heavy metal efflux system